jgi:hypothetical protein
MVGETAAHAAEWREATKSTLPWHIQMTTPAPARTESASRGDELVQCRKTGCNRSAAYQPLFAPNRQKASVENGLN